LSSGRIRTGRGFKAAALIIKTKPSEFFPTRPRSVYNIAEYDFTDIYLTVLPINVPVILLGLLQEI
jgi:hypothetical protein